METRIGGRQENQDCYGFLDTPFGALVVVCDGMGGYKGGAIASELAVRTIINEVENGDGDILEIIVNAVKSANRTIIDKAASSPELSGMGSTVALALINDDCAHITHLGDSRVYLLRNTDKVYRTVDDSVVSRLVASGILTEEQARTAPNSNIITKALGVSDEVDVEVDVIPYDKWDRFVLCTDGLWGAMPEKELLKMLGKRNDLQLIVERTVSKVERIGEDIEQGNYDNLTLAVLEMSSYSKKRSKMEKKYKLATIVLSVLLLGTLAFSAAYIYNVRYQSAKETCESAESASDHDLSDTLTIDNKPIK